MAVGRVLVLGGAGDMGSGVVEELVSLGVEADIGDINKERAQNVAQSLKPAADVGVVKVDVLSREELTAAVKKYDVVVNAVGPFYRFGYVVADALVKAGVNGVDICDDYDATEKILGLCQEALDKGVTFVTGLGWTPGLSNILAKKCCEMLGGEVDAVDIGWFGSAADSKGLAVVMHLFHTITGDVPIYLNGRTEMVKAGTSPMFFEFPKVGRLKLYYVGHPEPITIPRHLRVLERVAVRGCLVPQWQNSLGKMFVKMGLTSSKERLERLSRFIHRIEDVFRAGGLELSGVKVVVEKGVERVSYCSVGRMRKLTAAPAALGAYLILKGELDEKGVYPPEAVISPTPFLGRLEGVGVTAAKQ
ncbi:MAG: saccharopine dehydrogenase NADP-binding domain-containing protein [Candidatus Caldarchaeum sp.]|uniref:Saccharopine dehydrogenase n=1 Tax=Caldiarchaeum subterraneum TaxID=311458 RepID=A0A7C5Q6V5_CALS0